MYEETDEARPSMVNLKGRNVVPNLSSAEKISRRLRLCLVWIVSSLDAFLHNSHLLFPEHCVLHPDPQTGTLRTRSDISRVGSPICETKKRQKTHLVIVHPPQLDLPVIGPTDDQRHAWVEIGPVHSPGGKHL